MASSTTLSNYAISNSESIAPQKINQIINNLIDNDKLVYSRFDKIPGVWKNLWYNDDSISGYSRGDFFWLNTESTKDFLEDNADEMREIANANPHVIHKLPEWKPNNEEIFNLYYNVLTGYMDETKSQPLSAMYVIGELSASSQLIVSQFDNNKFPVSDETAWKRFFITDDDYDTIVKLIYDNLDEVMAEHDYFYHFGSETMTSAISASLSNYANSDFSNVDIMYSTNYLKNGGHSSGMDSVEYFVRKPYSNRSLSGYTVENQWFRKWRSGYLEHGGTIAVSNYFDKLSTEISVNFDWSLVGEDSKVYDIKYMGQGDSAISVDESQDIPAGDNLISVLYELDKDDFKIMGSTVAPIYGNSNYMLNLVPIYQNAEIPSEMSSVESYQNLGDNHSPFANMANVVLDPEKIYPESFAFYYDKENTPLYYSYYAAGFCVL